MLGRDNFKNMHIYTNHFVQVTIYDKNAYQIILYIS